MSTRYGGGGLLLAPRPWLNLYNNRLPATVPAAAASSSSSGAAAKDLEEPPIERLLPTETLLEVLARCSPETRAAAACVCRRWRYLCWQPSLWRSACLDAWAQLEGRAATELMVRTQYDGSWRRMFLSRPRLRYGGVYAARNTYIKPGITDWESKNPVHLVVYYRYLRFFPDGWFTYRTTATKVAVAAKLMRRSAQAVPPRGPDADGLLRGRYTLHYDRVEACVVYPGRWPTKVRLTLQLRNTVRGANNRLVILQIVSGADDADEEIAYTAPPATANTDDDAPLHAGAGARQSAAGFPAPAARGTAAAAVAAAAAGPAAHEARPEPSQLRHTRGLAPFEYIEFARAPAHAINLPVDKMDFYSCGAGEPYPPPPSRPGAAPDLGT